MSTTNTTPPRPDTPADVGATRLAAIIRGDQRAHAHVEADLQVRLDRALIDIALVEEARAHGVQGLLRHALRDTGQWEQVSEDVRTALDADARHLALSDAYFRQRTARAISALHSAGVRTLIFKGEALACTHYQWPHLRPRCDTDMLVAERDIELAGQVLQSLDYLRPNMVDRDVVHSQRGFVERTGPIRHVIDLHWRISNQLLFAGMYSFDELAADAIPWGESVPRAWAPGPVHALLLACIHRVAHHDNSERLIWLYDIALLADRLSKPEWRQLERLAEAKALSGVCAAGLETASNYFRCSPLTAAHIAVLLSIGTAQREDAGAYLEANLGGFRRLLRDARYAGGWSASLRLLYGHAIPDAAFMRRAYGVEHPVALAGAYLHRAARGLRRLTS